MQLEKEGQHGTEKEKRSLGLDNSDSGKFDYCGVSAIIYAAQMRLEYGRYACDITLCLYERAYLS